MQLDKPLFQAGPLCQAAECRIPLGLITSQRGVNGAVATHSSSPTPRTRLYLEAEIGARLHQ